MRRFVLTAMALLPVLAWVVPPGSAEARTRAAATTEADAARTRGTRARATASTDTAAPARAARPATPAQEAQRQRMRDCNAEARTRSLSGPTRSAFMRPCLGGNPPAAGAAN